MKSARERVCEKLPSAGVRELDARIEAGRLVAAERGGDDSFDVRFTVDSAGRVTLDVPRRFPWREVG